MEIYKNWELNSFELLEKDINKFWIDSFIKRLNKEFKTNNLNILVTSHTSKKTITIIKDKKLTKEFTFSSNLEFLQGLFFRRSIIFNDLSCRNTKCGNPLTIKQLQKWNVYCSRHCCWVDSKI